MVSTRTHPIFCARQRHRREKTSTPKRVTLRTAAWVWATSIAVACLLVLTVRALPQRGEGLSEGIGPTSTASAVPDEGGAQAVLVVPGPLSCVPGINAVHPMPSTGHPR